LGLGSWVLGLEPWARDSRFPVQEYHRPVMATLNAADIDQQLAALTGWERVDQAIRKQYTFQDFPEAVLFVSALVPGAESADHHPDIEIHYKRVTLTYSTHSEGGLTQKDFDGARAADDVAEQVPHLREFGDG